MAIEIVINTFWVAPGPKVLLREGTAQQFNLFLLELLPLLTTIKTVQSNIILMELNIEKSDYQMQLSF